jgi:hypothetical protein
MQRIARTRRVFIEWIRVCVTLAGFFAYLSLLGSEPRYYLRCCLFADLLLYGHSSEVVQTQPKNHVGRRLGIGTQGTPPTHDFILVQIDHWHE